MDGMIGWVTGALLGLVPVLAIAGAGHAMLYKRDPRAAFGWIAVCLMFPLVGPFLYFLFGINRVRTRAQELTRHYPFRLGVAFERGESGGVSVPIVAVPAMPAIWRSLARLSGNVTRLPLIGGNRVEPLENGEAAYPPMLAAIDGARERVFLATYIFESNRAGRDFIDALERAHQRGVDVRVMIDGLGELYSWPRAGRLLERRGVRVERFMRPRLWPPSFHINLRNHRKLLVVDGHEAFVGGMNIGDRHLLESGNRHPVADTHFRLRGPIVTQVEVIFAEDWRFTTGETIEPSPSPDPLADGAICRAFSDGPDEDLDKLNAVLIGAVTDARERIDIMTPYFIPERPLMSALQIAALRGVEVNVILPEKSNLRYVDWATRNLLWELLHYGVRILYQPAPFNHGKLFAIDGRYSLIGSANLDPRSLRLNFELAVEVYDTEFAKRLHAQCEAAIMHSHRVTLVEVDARRLPERVRDAFCWLFSPYI